MIVLYLDFAEHRCLLKLRCEAKRRDEPLDDNRRLFLNYSRDTKKAICILFHLNAFIGCLGQRVTQFRIDRCGGTREERKRRNVKRRNVKRAARGLLARSKVGKQSRGLLLHHCHYPVSNNSETISLSLTFFS